jgi:hypothetical protein
MRRLALLAAAFTAVATLTLVGSASASNRAARHIGTHAGPSTFLVQHPVKNTTITAGSTFTLYFYDPFYSTTTFCEVLSFGSGHIFTSDLGDVGKWKGQVSLTFTGTSGVFGPGWKYKGTWQSAGFFSGMNEGVITPPASAGDGSAPWGPFVLDQGTDPLGEGGC